ncbi:MAG TPA: hypothetical protein VD861_18995 [Pyrinomonadaceae bacterium]|nr:hypothetical protein [Pyrinomonadaceae bacterium]
MRNKIIASAFLALLCVGSGFGQSSPDAGTKYGRPETVYSVSEHVWMTPEYSADGQVCLMRLYPKRIAPGINYLDDGLDMAEVLKILNELIPLETRGNRKEFFGMTEMGGGVAWTRFNYERVTFTFVSPFEVVGELLDRPDEVLLPYPGEKAISEARRKEAMRPDDELIREYAGKPKVLEIRWLGRECVSQ